MFSSIHDKLPTLHMFLRQLKLSKDNDPSEGDYSEPHYVLVSIETRSGMNFTELAPFSTFIPRKQALDPLITL